MGGKPQLEDGRVVDAGVVIWATGFQPNFGWIDLPVFDGQGFPVHRRGIVEGQPGLYSWGCRFSTL